MKKKNKTDLISFSLLVGVVIALISMLFGVLGWLVDTQEIFHQQKMDELNLEKEIALINNPVSNMFECRNDYPTTYGNYFLELENKSRSN